MEPQCCSICLDELGAAPHTLACGHAFHTDCILAWARSDSVHHARCPVCREPRALVADTLVASAMAAGDLRLLETLSAAIQKAGVI